MLSEIGSNLHRPECVLTTAKRNVYTSNWRGGVSAIESNGKQTEILAPKLNLRPNGIALLSDGTFLVCHLGDTDGGVFRLLAGGRTEPFVVEVDGVALPPTNFAHLDHENRIWITVSTHKMPRADAYNKNTHDGIIVLYENGKTRLVADELGYTNECIVHPNGQYLYVNETFIRRLSRFKIMKNGDLTQQEIIADFGAGTFPDGLCFDEEGAAWITSIVSNRIIRVTDDGKQQIVLEDSDPEHVEWVEQAYQTNSVGRSHLDTIKSARLQNISSMAFGGADLKTVYLGCLLGDKVMSFRSPVAGHPPAHWKF